MAHTEKQGKARRVSVITVCVIPAALLAADIAIGNYMVSFAIKRSSASGSDVAPKANTSSETNRRVAGGREQIKTEMDTWPDSAARADMVYPLYEACPTQKALYIAEGAGHGQALFIDPETYERQVFDFLSSVMEL